MAQAQVFADGLLSIPTGFYRARGDLNDSSLHNDFSASTFFDQASNHRRQSLQNQSLFVGDQTRLFNSNELMVPSKHFTTWELSGASDHLAANAALDGKGSDRTISTDIFKSPRKNAPEKRRLSALDITTTFFDDNDSKYQSRRSSIASISSFADDDISPMKSLRSSIMDVSRLVAAFDASLMNNEDDDDDEEDEDIVVVEPTVKDAPQPSQDIVESADCDATAYLQVPALGQSEMKEIMETFTSAMAKSTMTQQAIHDWDKKMGLKRSHSKTMRQSMRSRKKLKTMIKKDISSMSK